MKNEKLIKEKTHKNQDDSPKKQTNDGEIGVDRSEELKITEDENDLEK